MECRNSIVAVSRKLEPYKENVGAEGTGWELRWT